MKITIQTADVVNQLGFEKGYDENYAKGSVRK